MRVVEHQRELRQVDRLVASQVLHNSESLCNLLRFLARQALEHPGVPIREHHIATEMLGRSEFDPRLDSTVRVQTGRLRQKLTDYYTGEGRHDPLLIEIPKGTYTPIWTLREPEPEPAAVESVVIPAPTAPAAPPVAVPAWARWSPAALALLVILGAVAAYVPRSGGFREEADVRVLRGFWQGFLAQPTPPLVVFSNAEFVGRPETGLRYYDPERDDRSRILDHYTGVGEVLSLHELDELFFRLGSRLTVKRGRLLNWDDVKTRDILFLGSPAENATVRDLPGPRAFEFRRVAEGPRAGDLAIVNLSPRQGEPSQFLGSAGPSLTEDYALLQCLTGLSPRQTILVMAGTTTLGTQAAVEHLCRPAKVAELLARLPTARRGEVPRFNAVLHVRINGGVPVETRLVAFRAGDRE